MLLFVAGGTSELYKYLEHYKRGEKNVWKQDIILKQLGQNESSNLTKTL